MRQFPADATLPWVLYQIAFRRAWFSMEAIFEFAFRFPEGPERERAWDLIERAQDIAFYGLEEEAEAAHSAARCAAYDADR